jgi:formylglycine-generating enzyme
MRLGAIVSGGICGFLAGWFWGTTRPMPLVKFESLAALPASSAAPPMPAHSAMRQGDAPVRKTGSASPVGEELDLAMCGQGMRLVEGDYCTTLVHRCVEPFTDGSSRCNRYSEGVRCYPPVLAMRFCIDEFEFPNRRGEKPRVMVDFEEAKRACAVERKRLCTAREWTLACEGPKRWPYPTGFVRDRAACNIDLPHRFPSVEALSGSASVKRELERLDQRVPSGSMPGCVSQYGVYDLVGNVDEWVVPDGSEEAGGFGAQTALKGGYFGPVRARCRPSTPSHGPTFKFYQVGFRCCRDVAVARRAGSVGELAGARLAGFAEESRVNGDLDSPDGGAEQR